MTQSNPTNFTDTISGSEFATELNQDNQALLSMHKGSSRPSYAVAGTQWIDDSSTPWIIYMYDGSNDIKVGEIDPSGDSFTVTNADDADTLDGYDSDQTGTGDSVVVRRSSGEGNFGSDAGADTAMLDLLADTSSLDSGYLGVLLGVTDKNRHFDIRYETNNFGTSGSTDLVIYYNETDPATEVLRLPADGGAPIHSDATASNESATLGQVESQASNPTGTNSGDLNTEEITGSLGSEQDVSVSFSQAYSVASFSLATTSLEGNPGSTDNNFPIYFTEFYTDGNGNYDSVRVVNPDSVTADYKIVVFGVIA